MASTTRTPTATPRITYEEALRHLDDPKPKGNRKGCTAWCSCHHDRRSGGPGAGRSLSVDKNHDSTAVCHCFSCGATNREVFAALGLTGGSPRKPRRSPPRKKPLSTAAPWPFKDDDIERFHSYRDEGGRERFQIVKLKSGVADGKPFRPRSKHKGRWVLGQGGAPVIPYRLPELLAKLNENPAEPLWICEGEKADRESHDDDIE